MSVGDFDRKTVIINSQFRESGSTNDFKWRFQERVENVRYAELRYFVLENGVYNVDSSNDTFYLSEQTNGSGGYTFFNTIVLPHGYYDDQTFPSTIGLCMTSASLVSGCQNLYFVQISTTGEMYLSSNQSGKDFAIGFNNGIGGAYPGTADIMGFTYSTNPTAYESINSGLYLTIVGQKPTYIANFDYLLIQSQKLGNDISFYAASRNAIISGSDAPLQPSATSCFAFVPNTTSNTGVASLIFNNQRPPQISTLKFPYSLDYIDITIVDKLGNLIDTRGNNVSLVLELYCDKRSQNISTYDDLPNQMTKCRCR